jgi:hypothetical protein
MAERPMGNWADAQVVEQVPRFRVKQGFPKNAEGFFVRSLC